MNNEILDTADQLERTIMKPRGTIILTVVTLLQAIEAGEKSGYIENFDPLKHLAELNEKCTKLSTNQTQEKCINEN